MCGVIAVDNVCAWPNIKKLPNGEIISVIFNQPCHLLWEGTVECWRSSDNGVSWTLRGTPVLNEPGTNRGNVAVGLKNGGEIIVLCGGCDKAAPKPGRNVQGNISDDRIKYNQKDKNALWPIRSVSKDNGATWDANEIKVEGADDVAGWIPFGDIITLDSGDFGCSMYVGNLSAFSGKVEKSGAFFLTSTDDGVTWRCLSRISSDGNETELVKLPDGKILAAVRNTHLDLFESLDNGESWRHILFLTSNGMYPAGFTLLDDGHLLLTYGIRHKGLYGIGAMTMHLESEQWNTPMVIADFGDAWDGGYPSNVQLDDGDILTAYYCGPTTKHERYHMGVVKWNWLDIFNSKNSCPTTADKPMSVSEI